MILRTTTLFTVSLLALSAMAQNNDSIAKEVRSLSAKNFSSRRTLNLFWEAKASHHYTNSFGNHEIEEGKKRNLNTINFSAMLPVVKTGKVSVYASLQYNCVMFDTRLPNTEALSENKYEYYSGGVDASYYTDLFGGPFIVSANLAYDAWSKGAGIPTGRFTVISVLKRSKNTSVSAGLAAMFPSVKALVLPVFTYWHRFGNPHWSVDITLPSQLYMRYQHGRQRVSLGTVMTSESYYVRTPTNVSALGQQLKMPGLSTCYYSESMIKPELQYEYLVGKHFYLTAHAGVAFLLKGGLYKKDRKGITVENEYGYDSDLKPIVSVDHKPLPFFNLGISYSIFE